MWSTGGIAVDTVDIGSTSIDKSQGSTFDCTVLALQGDTGDWTSFVAEWGNFKRCTGIADNQVTDQLYQCCEKSLARLLIREEPDIVSQGETELLAAMKRLAVIKIATSVRRTNAFDLGGGIRMS